MTKTNKEAQKEALNTLADLVGKGVTGIYKMFVRNTIVQGLILVLIALCFMGGAGIIAVGIILPGWSWALIVMGVATLAWAISLLANPAYHALEDLLERLNLGKKE